MAINLSRRSFLKSSAAAAAVTATSAASAGEVPAEWAKPKCDNWSWEKPARPLSDFKITKTVDTDVVVIGAGLAGFAAALSAAEAGAKVALVEKTGSWSARGGHITGVGTKEQKAKGVKVDAREIIRHMVIWGQGRMDERLLWQFFRKCGSCLDWAIDIAAKHDTKVTLWEGYYKGPDYTEYPVTHFFYNKDVSLDYTYGVSKGIGNVALMPCFEEELKKAGVSLNYRTPAVQLIKEGDRVTGLIAGRPGNYTRFNAKKGVIITTGCYGSNMEMRKRWAPFTLKVDAQIYYPTKSNTGDGVALAYQVGGVMQRNESHAATVHLEAGAASYGFLHVNKFGRRFMNEDVNTQSKSCDKELQPGGIAWSVYDADWAEYVKKQVDSGEAGGLFYGQMWQPWGDGWNIKVEKATLEQHIKDGKAVTANTIEELAAKMGVPAAELKKTVDRYNEMVKKGVDDDFGKRKALLTPIVKPPFIAGKLASSLLAMSGGLHTDPSLHVLDKDDKPIAGLYVAGAAAGDYFGSGDYPTLCPGMNHGRALTFGRLAGIMAAGGNVDKMVPTYEI